jgi:pantetheine-phosphate adenylyltransferase
VKERICIYPGTFGPLTLGHEWIIEEALKIFDYVHVLIAENKAKKPIFSMNERLFMIESVTNKYGGKVEVVKSHDVYTVQAAKILKATHIVRGIRSGIDFDYERGVDLLNRDIYNALREDSSASQGVSTIYMTPPRHLAEVSSSMAMSLVGFKGWETVIKNYVSQPIFDAIKKAYDGGHLANRP